MNMLPVIRFSFLAAFTLGGVVADAQVPQLLNYQGRVQVGTNDFNGSGQFKFALVNADGSTTYWSNDGTSSGGSPPATGVSLAVTRGLYAVALGSSALPAMQPLPPTVFTNADVHLRVWFNDGTNGFQQFVPDQRIAAVGYAMMAATAQTAAAVNVGAITSAMLADGAVTSGKLAAGAVTAPAVAAGAVNSNAIAAGAVGATQLARKYAAGRLDASLFQGTTFFGSTELTTNYGFNFSVPPILNVEIDPGQPSSNALANLVIADKQTNAFTLRLENMQPRETQVAAADLDIVNPSTVRGASRAFRSTTWTTVKGVGAYNSVALVEGHPAVACFNRESNQLIYLRALDAYGYQWGEPTAVNADNGGGSYTSLAVVNGRPAIAYRNDATRQLKFARAADATGSAWQLSEILAEGVGGHLTMAVVNGRPAIAYRLEATGELRFIRAGNADGGTWGVPATIPGSSGVSYPSMKVVNGQPAIAYHSRSGNVLAYVRALDPDGTAWPFAQVVDFDLPGRLSLGEYAALEILPGLPAKPAIAYFADSSGHTNQLEGSQVRFIRAADLNGSTWETPQVLAKGVVRGERLPDGRIWALNREGADIGRGMSMALVQGIPAVIFRDIKWMGGGRVVEDQVPVAVYSLIKAQNASGSAWLPKSDDIIPGWTPAEDERLLATPTVPGFAYSSSEGLLYFAAEDSEGERWSGHPSWMQRGETLSPSRLVSQVTLTNGRPYVIYYDQDGDVLRGVPALDNSGSAWDGLSGRKTIDGGNVVGNGNSIALFRGGIGAAYFDSTAGNLNYVFHDGSSWSAPIKVDAGGSVGAAMSLAYVGGVPAVAYYSTINGGSLWYVRAASGIGTSWESPKALVNSGVLPALAMKVINGRPAVAYCTTDQRLRYLQALDGEGAGWGAIATAATLLDPPADNGVDLAEVNGSPAAVFKRGSQLHFVRASNPDGTTWGAAIQVDSSPPSGILCSLAMIGGRPAVAYVGNSQLRFVRASDQNGSVWPSHILVDKTTDNYNGVRLAEVGGLPAIAYHRDSLNGPQWATGTSVTGEYWSSPVTIDGTGDAGTFLSLAANRDEAGIAYFEASDGALRVVRSTDRGRTWAGPYVPDSGRVGKHLSVALVHGTPAVSYYDESAGDLRFIRAQVVSNQVQWLPGDIRTVDTNGKVGLYTSLTTLSNGFPAIAYYDASNRDLKWARATHTNGLTWGSPVTLDAAGDAGRHASLTVVAGNPAVAYQRIQPTGSNELVYVRATDAAGAAWLPPLVVNGLAVPAAGPASLIVIGNRPAIAFVAEGTRSRRLMFTQASDPAGTSWPEPRTIEELVPSALAAGCILREVNGKPTICYAVDITDSSAGAESATATAFQNLAEVRYVVALDASGTTWSPSQAIAKDSRGSISLDSLNRNPSVTFLSADGVKNLYPVAFDVNWFAVEP